MLSKINVQGHREAGELFKEAVIYKQLAVSDLDAVLQDVGNEPLWGHSVLSQDGVAELSIILLWESLILQVSDVTFLPS